MKREHLRFSFVSVIQSAQQGKLEWHFGKRSKQQGVEFIATDTICPSGSWQAYTRRAS